MSDYTFCFKIPDRVIYDLSYFTGDNSLNNEGHKLTDRAL